jgi:hypothetical protein
MGAIGAIGVGAAAGGRQHQRVLAAQRRAARPVSPAHLQHHVQPLLEQRRRGVPLHRKLERHHLGRLQGRLLGAHVDVEIGVAPIQVMHRHTGQTGQRLGERLVGAGAALRGVRVDHQDARGSHEQCGMGRRGVLNAHLRTAIV